MSFPAFEPARSPEARVQAARIAGLRDPRVLDALRRVRRDRFGPADARALAWEDLPIPIRRGQVTTPPCLVACMFEAPGLTGTERELVGG